MAAERDLGELANMIERMETRYAQIDDNRVVLALMEAYGRLKVRLEQDLEDPRDTMLSKAAALMMVKSMVEPDPTASSEQE